MPADSRNVTATTDITKCLSLFFGKLKLYFLVFHNVMIVATYDFVIIGGYLAGNAKYR